MSALYRTENSGLLNNLLPGVIVLADRSFTIQDNVGINCVQDNYPKQFSYVPHSYSCCWERSVHYFHACMIMSI